MTNKVENFWTNPTPEMLQAGLAEVQRITEEWDTKWNFDLSEVTDSEASDMALSILQAMAGKLPKVGE